ncbi:IS21 family transposase [Acidithiobacillus ferrivorans]|uniref:IS21 family transposase n=1 Tax=Acidithiobacillus ferrivorans TaxID=160808 RepID=A0A7T4WGF7_9PROT|nr:IS21 family transposase [Acidithiobacillus ferrivorans]QQD74144.1 IS21 family transposase [Acidithiobacillus ferrivorans]QQD74229.1 IS21 family transposase [Acidithiobacillus ferrivorans]
MKAIQEVIRLHAAGLSQRQIAQACRLSKGAVGKYLQKAEQASVSWPLPPEMDPAKLEALLFPSHRSATVTAPVMPDFATIHTEMRRKGMTLQLLWEEYMAAHDEQRVYQYSQFCTHYRAWKGCLKRSMRQNHLAGDKLFIDYAGPTVPIIDPGTGEIRRAQIFVAVLGASSYTYCEATWSQSLSDFLGSHVRALRYFGGVPVLLVPDNLKAAVTNASRYEPEINRSYQDLATHYGAVVLPTRPYKPKDKAKVEVGVQVVERWILARLRHFQFFSLMDLNRDIRRLLEDLNQRPFKQLPGSRKSTFEALDRPALKPLPAQDYVFAVWKTAKVSIDYHVEYNRHRYSVPYRLAHERVDLLVSARTVEIFHQQQRVASHLREDSQGRYSTLTEHMPKAHQRHSEWTPGRLLNWALSIGPATRDVVRWQLESKPHPEQGYRSCLGLLSLSRSYDKTRLNAACLRAMKVGSPTTNSVKSILQQRLDQIPETPQKAAPLPAHDNIRGPRYYH